MKLIAIIQKEDDMFVSWSPDLDISSQGYSKDEALNNLKESIELCMENTSIRNDIIKKLNKNDRTISEDFEINIS